jgi:WD40 repeat protein
MLPPVPTGAQAFDLDHDHSMENPFPGLRPFEPDDSDLFKGRDAQTSELIDKLVDHHFVAVIGVSGSGKSSLVKAGVVADLYSGLMPGAYHWRVALFRPGDRPIESLVKKLNEEIGNDCCSRDSLFTSDQELIKIANRLPGNQNLLVVVDQFEEIFRFQRSELDKPEKDRAILDAAHFVRLLVAASEDAEDAGKRWESRLFVILTMRADYLGECSQFINLPEAINQGEYLVPRMSGEDLRQSILEPIRARSREIRVEKRLVLYLIDQIGSRPDQLPVLQHALMRTWEHWVKKIDRRDPGPPERWPELTYQDFKDEGGFDDAMNRHAEDVFSRLGDGLPRVDPASDPTRHHERELAVEKRQKLAELLFQRITERRSVEQSVRDARKFSDILGVARERLGASREELVEVINHFRKGPGTFITSPTPPDEELNDDSYIDITHESLIKLWNRLGGKDSASDSWISKEFDSAQWYRRLTDAEQLSRVPVKEKIADNPIVGSMAAVFANRNSRQLWRNPTLDYVLRKYCGTTPQWTKLWSRRYNKCFDESMAFLERSRISERWRRIRRVGAVALVLFAAWFAALFLLTRGQKEQLRASNLGNAAHVLSSDDDNAISPYKIERSALLAAESRGTPTEANSNLSDWQNVYARLPKSPVRMSVKQTGECSAGVDSVVLLDQLGVVAALVHSTKPKNASAATAGGCDHSAQDVLQWRYFSKNDLNVSTLKDPVNEEYRFLSRDGRFTSRICAEKKPCVSELNGEPRFVASAPGTPKVLAVSQDRKVVLLGYSVEDTKKDLKKKDLKNINFEAWKRDGSKIEFCPVEISGDAISAEVSNDAKHATLRARAGDGSFDLMLLNRKNGTCSGSAPAGDRLVNRIVDARFSPDDYYLAIGKQDGIELHHLPQGSDFVLDPNPFRLAIGRPIAGFAFGNAWKDDHHYLAVSTAFSEFSLYEVSNATQPTEAPSPRRRHAAPPPAYHGPPPDDAVWKHVLLAPVQSVAFDATDKLVAVGAGDSTARVYDVVSGRETTRLGYGDRVNSVVFDPGSALSGAADPPQDEWVYTGSEDGKIAKFLVNSRSSKQDEPEERIVPCPAVDNHPHGVSGYPVSAALSEDGKWVAVGCVSDSPDYSQATGSSLVQKRADFGPPSNMFLPKSPRIFQGAVGRCVVAAGGSSRTVFVCLGSSPGSSTAKLWTTGQGQVTLDEVKVNDFRNGYAVAAGRKLMATGGEVVGQDPHPGGKGLATVYKLPEGTELCKANLESRVISIGFGGKDDKYLAVGTSLGQLALYSTTDCRPRQEAKLLRSLEFKKPITAIRFDPMARLLGFGSPQRADLLKVADMTSQTKDGQPVKPYTWTPHRGQVRAIAFGTGDDPLYPLFASADDTGVVKIIRTEAARAEASPEYTVNEAGVVFDVQFSGGGNKGKREDDAISILSQTPLQREREPYLQSGAVSVTKYLLKIDPKSLCDALPWTLDPDEVRRSSGIKTSPLDWITMMFPSFGKGCNDRRKEHLPLAQP